MPPGPKSAMLNASAKLLKEAIPARIPAIVLVLTLVAAVSWLISPLPIFARIGAYIPLHTLLGFASATIAFSIFGLGWNTLDYERPTALSLVSCAFLFIGAMDVAHALSFHGMPDFITPNDMNKSLNFWLIGRFAIALTFLFMSTAPWRPYQNRNVGIAVISAIPVAIAMVLWLGLAHPGIFPSTFVEGKGVTLFKQISEWILIALNSVSAILLLRRAKIHGTNFVWLAASAWIMALGGVLFSQFETPVDFQLVAGHIFKVIADYFVYHAVFVSGVRDPYRRLEETQRQLETNRIQLETSQLALDNADDLVLWFNREGRILNANRSACRRLGYSPAELTELSAGDLIPSLARHSWPEHWRKVQENGHIRNDSWFTGRSAEIFPVEMSSNYHRIDGGEYICSFVRDISDRLQAQIELADSRNYLKTIVENEPECVKLVDRSGHLLDINPAGLAMLQAESLEQIKDIEYRTMIVPEDRALYLETLDAVFRGETRKLTFTVAGLQGRKLVLEMQAVPLWAADSKTFVKAVLGVAHDITERIEVEHELRKLSLAIEQSPASIAVTDRSGKIEYINPRFEEITGYSRQEVIGQNMRMLKSGETSRETYKTLWSTILSGRTWRGELHNKRKNGELFWEKSTISPIMNRDGSISHFVSMKEDVSDLKDSQAREAGLQRRLQQASKMEAIGQLAGGIAHDFNNILGAILGFAELAQMLLPDSQKNSEKLHRYVGEIILASQRARDLIAQMLIFSRLRPELEDTSPSVVLLNPIVKEVIGLLRSSMPTTITLNYRIDDPEIRAGIQAVHLHQVLMNLCINARDAIGEYGTIQISTTTRDAGGICDACLQEFSGRYIEIAVADSGPGIEETIRAKMFEPFFTSKEVGKGTGMGLAVVHGVVHALGGHIIVESAAGSGATIRILLPEPAPDTLAKDDGIEASLLQEQALAGLRIMVVDDERAMGSMLVELLEMQGAAPLFFENGKKALAHFQTHLDQIDLVLTDETMPELSGFSMAREMLKTRPDLPIVLCTGHSDYVDQGMALESGIGAFLNKPLDLAKLVQTIKTLASRNDTPTS